MAVKEEKRELENLEGVHRLQRGSGVGVGVGCWRSLSGVLFQRFDPSCPFGVPGSVVDWEREERSEKKGRWPRDE